MILTRPIRPGQRLVETNYGPMLVTELNRPDGKVLLCEYNTYQFAGSSDHGVLNEGSPSIQQNGHSLILSGKLQAHTDQNQNGRSYPRHVLEREVENYRTRIQMGNALGHLDHPNESSEVLYSDVSHRILSLEWKGNELWGKVEIFNHPGCPPGYLLGTLHTIFNVPIGMSSRALGSLSEVGGRTIVNDDLQIICWDAVTDPSTHNAFVVQDGFSLRENKTIAPKSPLDSLFTFASRLNQK
jgi:hypothetical protein